MTGRSPLRSCEDLDETVLQYAEFKAMATSDPRVKEKMETDNEINRLTVLKSSWQSQQTQLQEQVGSRYPARIARIEKEIAVREEDIRTYQSNKTEDFRMVIEGHTHEERAKAADLEKKVKMHNGKTEYLKTIYESYFDRLNEKLLEFLK